MKNITSLADVLSTSATQTALVISFQFSDTAVCVRS